HTDMLGDVMFYGKGAGKLPTASAVVADVIDASRYGTALHDTLTWAAAPAHGVFTDPYSYTYYIRAQNQDMETFKNDLGGAQLLMNHRRQLAALTHPMNDKELAKCLAKLEADGIRVALVLKMLAE
ncbi:MAG: homoserine dehydrogenase, partial [Pygmaiobacter sp.]